ncbi:MAG: hypothetical protein AABX13_03440 [Nanoarchaeota archaeon]
MTRQRFEGKGISLEDALEDLQQSASEIAQENNLALPTSLISAGHNYVASIRPLHGKYTKGPALESPQLAYEAAVAKARMSLAEVDPEKHRVRISATYELRSIQEEATTAAARPSGAAPARRYQTGVEDRALY